MTSRFSDVFVIINPASGHNEPILNTLNAIFRDKDIAWDVGITHRSGDGAALARQAVEAGHDLVVAYGGDGTLLDVAEGLLYSDVPMAILPGGTANALAADIGIPPQLAAAVRLVFDESAQVRTIDVGKTNERHFLLRIGTGMIATLSERVTRQLKDRFGIGAYFIAAVDAINNPQFVTYSLSVDGESIETQGTACLISNSNAMGALGIRLSKRTRIDDGLLDVFILNTDLNTVLGMAASIAQIDNPAVSLQHWQGREIILEADPPQGIYGDGENIPFAETPSTTTVLPAALKVLMPGHSR